MAGSTITETWSQLSDLKISESGDSSSWSKVETPEGSQNDEEIFALVSKDGVNATASLSSSIDLYSTRENSTKALFPNRPPAIHTVEDALNSHGDLAIHITKVEKLIDEDAADVTRDVSFPLTTKCPIPQANAIFFCFDTLSLTLGALHLYLKYTGEEITKSIKSLIIQMPESGENQDHLTNEFCLNAVLKLRRFEGLESLVILKGVTFFGQLLMLDILSGLNKFPKLRAVRVNFLVNDHLRYLERILHIYERMLGDASARSWECVKSTDTERVWKILDKE